MGHPDAPESDQKPASGQDYSLAVTPLLGMLGKYQRDFKALGDLYEGALEVQKHCYEAGAHQSVLDFMNALGQFLHLQGHWREARKHVAYARQSAGCQQDAQALKRWTFYAGEIHSALGEYLEAEPCYRESLALAAADGDLTLQGQAWRHLGWLAHVRGDFVAAKQCYLQAVDLHRRAGNKLGEAYDRRQLGMLALDEDQYAQAAADLQASLQLIGRERSLEALRLRAGASSDLGRLAFRQGHWEQAQQYLNVALSQADQAQDSVLQENICFHLTRLYEEQGRGEEAWQVYKTQLDLAGQVGNRTGQASALIALGTLALRQGEYESARQDYTKALVYADRTNSAVVDCQLGTLAYLRHNYGVAYHDLRRALEVFVADGRLHEQGDCLHQLGLVAESLRRYPEAEKHYLESLEIRRTLGLFCEVALSYYHLGRLAQPYDQTRARSYYQQALNLIIEQRCSNLSQIRETLEQLCEQLG